MSASPPIYQVLETGKRILIGFTVARIPDDHRFVTFRDDIIRLAKEHAAVEVAFDLAEVRIVPSLMLGLMAWLSRNKIDVSVHHASDEIRDTLAFTDLDTIIDVCDTET